MQLEIVDRGYFMITQISTHSFKYRGFKIIKLKVKKGTQRKHNYSVQLDEQEFGLSDSIDSAAEYIDKLYAMRGIHTGINKFVFNGAEKVE